MTNKAWFAQAKYGMMIHFGLYSLLAGQWRGQRNTGCAEWIQNFLAIPNAEYSQLAKAFNPIYFNAEEWVTTAKEAGMDYTFYPTQIDDAHPNTVLLRVTGFSGKHWEIEGAPMGDGRISIRRINGTPVDISGDATTLLVYHLDTPGMISDVTNILARRGVNIGRFELRRAVKGGEAVMVIEIDGDIEDSVNDMIRRFPNVYESIVLKAI